MYSRHDRHDLHPLPPSLPLALPLSLPLTLPLTLPLSLPLSLPAPSPRKPVCLAPPLPLPNLLSPSLLLFTLLVASALVAPSHGLQYLKGPSYTKVNAGGQPVFEATWSITKEKVAGFCATQRPTELVNKELPGPIVEVVEGTQIIVTFKNEQDTPMTVHWHGIKQKGSPWSDGVSSVTQCPIQQGQSFTYNFSTEGHSGTLWWHAHVAFVRHTVLGGLNVIPRTYDVPGRIKPPVPIADETTIFISDWYEASSKDLMSGILGSPYSGWPPADTLLLNGATRQHCTPMFEFVVKPWKWYRLRVINSALYATMNFAVQFHNLWTYESEGGYLKPRRFPTYDVMSGQSYSFLMYTSQKPGAYWMGGRPRFEMEGYGGIPALGVLRYEGVDKRKNPKGRGFYTGPNLVRNPFFTQGQLEKTVAATPPAKWAKHPTRLIILELNMNNDKDNKGQDVTRYSVNGITLNPPAGVVPLLEEYKGNAAALGIGVVPDLPPVSSTKNVNQKPSKLAFGVIDLQYGEVVQLVFQGHQPPGLNHPLHLHGHQFYVVARGPGKFDASKWNTSNYNYNLENPVERNTAWLLENEWTAVRFKADNPGVWIMHCHLEPHVDGGMMALFRTHKQGAIPAPPKDLPAC